MPVSASVPSVARTQPTRGPCQSQVGAEPQRGPDAVGQLMAHEVDVDVAGAVHDALPHPRGEHRLPAQPARGADDDLAGVDAGGEVEQGLRDVVALDDVEGAAQLRGQPAQLGDPFEPGVDQTVGRRHVDRDQLAAGTPRGDLRAAAQEGATLRASGQGDDDALPGGPGLGDGVLGAVLPQPLLHPVGHPQQRQLAQGAEVPLAEVVGERGVDLVGAVDVPVRQAPAQRLGRHVHELDLVGTAHDVVRHRLLLSQAGDRLHHVVERLQVLDVDRRDRRRSRPRGAPPRPPTASRAGCPARCCVPGRRRARPRAGAR